MGKQNKIIWTSEQDALIRRVYQSRKRGGNKELSAKLNLRPGLISARAAKLGLAPLIITVERARPDQLKSDEMALVRAHLGEPIAQIRARLYSKGYSRSLCSIRSLIRRMRRDNGWPTLVELMDDRDSMSTEEVCAGMGVGNHIVESWVKKGWLKVKRLTGNEHFAISRKALRRFMLTYQSHWDHRTVDHWFLLDILCGDSSSTHSIKVT